jgi:hypothetical protein
MCNILFETEGVRLTPRGHDTHDRGIGRKKRMDEKRLNGKHGLETSVYSPRVEGHVI